MHVVILGKFKRKNSIILTHFIANALCILQFLLLDKTAGIVSCIVAVCRGLTFLYLSRDDHQIHVSALVVFVTGEFVVTLATWDNWHSVLLSIPALYTYGQWQKDVKVLRLTLFFTSLAVGVCSLLSYAIAEAINEFIQIASILVAFIRFRNNKQTI